MDEKVELLELHDEEQKHEQNLSFKTLVMVYLAMFVALGLLLPKIYIANQIYYLSRDIAEISGKRDVLLEEYKALNTRLENLRYKNQILNPLQDPQWK
ncbi:hypothetical protein CCAL9344_00355 [Campylobacter sp. RM9344]|uniref:Cell division protein FtsL n=1 Tax=Campylobacter californiensis TaxID=1032243 RepID=A0AAW3ZUK4_9BACT|nr:MULTISPECIES: hypothetical protein [unclassified Campylobacter]MBE2983801.1 hypothetical protein [Campylobacter sp. RM6883]MBE2985635.1 hypothetical protein [Campylobacter sp. RM12919]MBE2987336.1 hypothetical protein [Campylobacter sp. RM12920]MBE2994339.1 hypothetical protein [Campylobacter sp. RM6913]MBE3022201.1 hypothetical protein [Campylobacter sp. 7477a]MBE3028647.1 hypothetical protein [Campylobacter sp. RM9344]